MSAVTRKVLRQWPREDNGKSRTRDRAVPRAVFAVVREEAPWRADASGPPTVAPGSATAGWPRPGSPPPAPPPKLLDRVREVLRFKHYSLRTEEAYTGWIRRYVLFHGKRHPDSLGTEEVRAFLTDLAVNGRVAAATQNQALSALLFLYQAVLKREIGWLDDVERAPRPAKVPVVCTPEEVRAVLREVKGGPARLMAHLLYGSGLRLTDSESFREQAACVCA